MRQRTRDDVEREYGEQKWPAIERLIAAEQEADPGAGLDAVLARVARSQWRADDPLSRAPFILEGKRIDVPRSVAFGAARALVLELIADSAREDTELIAELGSGWGWMLLSAWANGGPREARYVAAEYTDAGRRAAGAIAALDPDLDFTAIAFDYHEPRLEGLGARRHAIALTAHSVEQIPEVKPDLIGAISGLAQQVTCLHFEPIGWQLPGYDGLGSSREYAEHHGYNRNLIDVLRAEEVAGRIAIEDVRADVFGINPENSTTVIRWHSASAG